MADPREPLTPDQVEAFARLVAEMKRSSTGLPLVIIDVDRNALYWGYNNDQAQLDISGTSATDSPGRITSLTIRPTGDQELTSGVMKYVQLGAITAALESRALVERAERVLEEARRDPSGLSEATRAVVLMASEPSASHQQESKRRHGGREPLTDDHLRNVALTYLEETGPGKAKKPLERMAARFGAPEETVRTWVARARKAGWLGPAVKGRAGAEPGPRLLAEIANFTEPREAEQ